MAINLTKGGKLGKYFYLKDEVEYGPVELNELLENIDKNTLVYFKGINWTEAKKIDELKKYFTTEEKVIEKVINTSSDFESSSNKKNFLVPVLLLLILSGGAYWYKDYKDRANKEEIERRQKAELDSINAFNDLLYAEELQRKQDSLFFASSAMLDSAKLIKLDIDYRLGIDRFKSLVSEFFKQISNHSSDIDPLFADTVQMFYDNAQISKQDVVSGLNSYYDKYQNLIESYQLIDSACRYESLEGDLGVYSINLYYKSRDNTTENPEKTDLISAIVKITPDFKIVYYTWIKRQEGVSTTIEY